MESGSIDRNGPLPAVIEPDPLVLCCQFEPPSNR
jgi:hypothetical protein